MTTVETALGPVGTSELGPTLMHEHIVTRSPGVHENWQVAQMRVENPRAIFEAQKTVSA
jgi:predicted metal-dependent phosphotriesterase family hydrolase